MYSIIFQSRMNKAVMKIAWFERKMELKIEKEKVNERKKKEKIKVVLFINLLM